MKLLRYAAAICGILCLWSAEAKEYPVYKIARAPKIDGELDDYAWKKLPEGRGFVTTAKGNPYAKERSTRFKMGYRGDFLYLAVECDEPDLKKLKAVKDYRDGWSFDDAIELFFLSKNGKDYMQMLANANGARWSKRSAAERESEPPTDWVVASGRTAHSWTLEMAIPLKFLELRDIEGIRFNIARNLPGAEKEKHVCWANVKTGFGDVRHFDTLKKQNSNGPADPELESNEINQAYDQYLYYLLREIGIAGKAYKELESRFGEAPDFDQVRAIQKKIAKEYSSIPKSQYGELWREWETAVSKVSVPRRNLEFTVDAKGLKDLRFHVNGATVNPVSGVYRFSLEEGATVLTLSAEKSAANASVKFNFAGLPELNQRWAYSAEAPADWRSLKFDDRKWSALPAKINSPKVYLRQIVIWNQKHDGRLRCINPSVRRWNFSQDSVEPLYLSLYSPTGLKIDAYEFLLDLPEGFTLLDMAPGARRNRLSLAPLDVKKEAVTPGGKKFTRWILNYDPKDIDTWRTADSLLGVFKDKSGKPGDKGEIRYSRRINGNVTEITGSLPYDILPPVNGRHLKNMIMSFYMGSMPQGMSREMTAAVIRDAVKSGMDIFSLYPGKGTVNDLVIENGGIPMFGFLNHPIWGARVKDGALVRLMKSNPELFAEYYTKERLVKENLDKPVHTWKQQFCPSLITGKYGSQFADAVRADYKNFFFKEYPDVKYVFLNWEQEPWTGTVYTKSTNPTGAFCFCRLCKDNFRTWAKLPANADLSNENIFKNYYELWRKFRYSQDAAVHKIVVDAIQSLGKKVMFYSWSNHFGYWEAAKDVPYTIFLGCPGNGTADGRQQIGMDNYMKFHKGKLGRKNIVGQRFVFFPQTYGWNTERKDGWLGFNVMSDDGYINPKTWKWETIRILATLQGGVDLQNPLEMVAGVKYYVGEATRMIAEYENIFYHGKRNDKLAESKEIAYPDLLVLELGKERLVLLFNEGKTPKTVTVRNLNVAAGQKAKAYYSGKTFGDPSKITLTIPADDAEVVHIK